MKYFDQYENKINAITKKYDSPLLEQTNDIFLVDRNLKNAINKSELGLAKNKRNVTIDDVFSLQELKSIWFALKTVDITKYSKDDMLNLQKWVNISTQNGMTSKDTYGLQAGVSLLDGIQGKSVEERLKRFGRSDGLFKEVNAYFKQINGKIDTYDSAKVSLAYQNVITPIEGSDITVDDLILAADIAKSSNFEESVYSAIEKATGKKVSTSDLKDLFTSIKDQQSFAVEKLEKLWSDAEDKIEDIKDKWRDKPPHSDTYLAKDALENLSVYDIFRGFEGREEKNAYTDLGNWATSTADGTSWVSQLTGILPTVSKLADVVDALEVYQDQFELTQEQLADINAILRYANAINSWNQYLQDLQNQRRMAAAAASAEQRQQQFNLRDTLGSQRVAKQRIYNQIADAANNIKDIAAATPVTGYNPHRILGGMKEVVSGEFIANDAIRKAFYWLSVAQTLPDLESSLPIDTVEPREPVVSEPIDEDVEKPAKIIPANILQPQFRKKAIEDLKKAYVLLKANELFFTKQVEPNSEDRKISKPVKVYYGIDASNLNSVEIQAGGSIDESLVYGLTEATEAVLKLYAETIPSIIRQNKKKSNKPLNNPPNIEIDYTDLDAQAETRAEALYTARDTLIAREKADQAQQRFNQRDELISQAVAQDKEEARDELYRLQQERMDSLRNFRAADAASMLNLKDFEENQKNWQTIVDPFKQTIELYKKINASVNEIATLQSEWNTALAQNESLLIAVGDPAFRDRDDIDQNIQDLISEEVSQFDEKTKFIVDKFKDEAKKAAKSIQDADREFIFGGIVSDLLSELAMINSSSISKYMNKSTLSKIESRIDKLADDLEQVQNIFKIYEDPFMVLDRELITEIQNTSSEPFVDIGSLIDLGELYQDYEDEKDEAVTRLSSISQNIVNEKFNKTTKFLNYVVQNKAIQLQEQYNNFIAGLPGYTSAGYYELQAIHSYMNRQSEWTELKENIGDFIEFYQSIENDNFTIPLAIKQIANNTEQWKRIDALFDDIATLNAAREGDEEALNKYEEDFLSRLKDPVEYLDWMRAEYNKNPSIGPSENYLLELALDKLLSMKGPIRQGFRRNILNILKDSSKKETWWDKQIAVGDYSKILKTKWLTPSEEEN